MKLFGFLSFAAILSIQTAVAQCSVTASNNSYQVNMTVYPIALSNVVNTGGDCTFRTEMYYSIEIVGTNAPSSMYTLQGRVHCAGQNRTFDLPNQGGTGVVTSANGSAPYINGNCADYSEMNCDQTVIIIQGPNIPYQEVICNYNVPLPVELVAFVGEQKDDAVLLSFTTASEKDNDFFTIEKTTDGANWELVENVQGNGTTQDVSNYQVLDRGSKSDLMYYRLSQTDLDGTNTIYKIIAVNYNAISDANYAMYPNPTVNGELNIVFETESDEPVLCNVYDIMGKQVASYIFSSSDELERITLPEYKSTYIVELLQENSVIARQRIVAN